MTVFVVDSGDGRRVVVAAESPGSAIEIALLSWGVSPEDLPTHDRTRMGIRPVASGEEWSEGVLPEDDLLWKAVEEEGLQAPAGAGDAFPNGASARP